MKQSFGKDIHDNEVTLYTLENEKIRMSVMDYGATLVSFVEKETGKDVVLGFESMAGYLDQTSYIGASIGRTANRIEKGIFTLNQKEYHIPINNNGNANHGGLIGFDKKIFDTTEKDDRIIFHYLSKDGEEGYPGNLDVTITYVLLEDGIEIISDGISDADTLFAYTNHSYFNLDESESVLNHRVKINADTYGLSDANGLTTEKIVSVVGTPFDFREFKTLGAEINEDHEQLRFGKGYDHFYPIHGTGFRPMVICQGETLQLTMSSDFPGMHMYTGNWLENKTGKKGHHYPERSAVAFEPEYCPNAINYEHVKEKPIVKKDEHLIHHIRYQIVKR